MAHLWIDRENAGWTRGELAGDVFLIDVHDGCVAPRPVLAPSATRAAQRQGIDARPLCVAPAPQPGAANEQAPLLLRCSDAPDETWLLFAAPSSAVAVNGERVALGVAALCDRDEIRIPGAERAFLGLERRAQIAPFRAAQRPVRCPLCTTAIEDGTPCVICPRCATAHHQRADLECWTRRTACVVCAQPTPLDVSAAWTPEQIWPSDALPGRPNEAATRAPEGEEQ